MKRILSLVVAVCLLLGCCPAEWAASPVTLSTQDKQELEAFLSRFEWYRDDYSRADPGVGTDWDHWTLLDCLVRNPLIVDYSKYPVAQPDTSWDLRRDPLGKWNTYWRFDEASVDWVLQYIFALSPSQIAGLKTQLEQHSAWVYRYRGSYYSMPGGIGGGNEATITQVERDSYYTRVTYRVAGGDGFWTDYGLRYALVSRTTYGGKQYWTLHASTHAPLAEGMPFLDVPEKMYYAEDVRWAYENGVTSGTLEAAFSPDRACTRAHAVTFLWRTLGQPQGDGATFSDVKAGQYYTGAVAWAVAAGVTGGTGNGKFSPDSPCTRAQIVTFLYRAAGSPAATGGSSFSDVPAGAYYGDAARWAVANGITTGTGNGKFSPDSPCTRGQIAAFLHRAAQRVPSWYGTYVAESGETLTVTRVTGTQVLLTARLLDAAGGWYTAARTLTFSNGAKTAATVPFRTGEALLVTYTLQGDRIIVDYPEGWWPDQEFLRQE